MHKIDQNLMRINNFPDNSAAKNFYKDVHKIKNILNNKYKRFIAFIKEIKPEILSNTVQVMRIGEKVSELQDDITIILEEKYLQQEIEYAKKYFTSLQKISSKILDFEQYTYEEEQLISQNKDDLNEFMPAKFQKQNDSFDQKLHIVEDLDTKQQIINQYTSQKNAIELAKQQQLLKISQLKQEIAISEGDKKILQDQIKNLQSEIEIIMKLKNPDGLNLNEEMQQLQERLKKEESELKLEEEKALKQSKDNYQIMKENIQKRINKFKDDFKENISSTDSYSSGFHFIFVIDDSSSIKEVFSQVVQSFQVVINSRKHLGKDRVTIIQFSSCARTSYADCPITTDFNLKYQGGGTDFTKAFQQAHIELQTVQPKFQPIIIFMTDGEADSKKSEKILEEMYKSQINKNFPLWTFCIGFNVSRNSQETIDRLAKAGNGGYNSRDISGSKFKLSYICDDMQKLLQTMEDIDKKISILDNADVFIEQLIQRLTEVTEHQYNEERRLVQLSQSKMQKAKENINELIKFQKENKESQKKIFADILVQKEEEKNEITKKWLEVTNKIHDQDSEIKGIENIIKNFDNELNGRQYQFLEVAQNSKVKQQEIEEHQQKIQQDFSKKGFVGDIQQYEYQSGLIKKINSDLVDHLDFMIIELKQTLKIIGQEFESIVPKMNLNTMNKNRNMILEKVAHVILYQDKRFSGEFSSQDLRKLIQSFLIEYQNEKNDLHKEILSFFQEKIFSLDQLYSPIQKEQENPEEKINNLKVVNMFYENEIKKFVDFIIPENDNKEVLEMIGTPQEKKQQLLDFIKKLQEKQVLNDYKYQIPLYNNTIKIQKYKEKAKKITDDILGDKQKKLDKKIKKLEIENQTLETKQENPKKQQLKELLQRYYFDMRKDFSQKVQTYVYNIERGNVLSRYRLLVIFLKPQIQQLLKAIEEIERKG